jgi:hypothetical protein
MATNLTIRLLHRPGTLAEASEALGRAGANIEGGCGYVCETGEGVFHVLVIDAERARRCLMDAGFEIQAERQVVLVPGGGGQASPPDRRRRHQPGPAVHGRRRPPRPGR